jgi:hypothetical protein
MWCLRKCPAVRLFEQDIAFTNLGSYLRISGFLPEMNLRGFKN